MALTSPVVLVITPVDFGQNPSGKGGALLAARPASTVIIQERIASRRRNTLIENMFILLGLFELWFGMLLGRERVNGISTFS